VKASRLLRYARERAKRKGLPCTLQLDWVRKRIDQGHCEATGLPFTVGEKLANGPHPFAPSIDRKDHSKGYTPDNCRVVVYAFNVMMGTWGEGIAGLVLGSLLSRNANQDLHFSSEGV